MALQPESCWLANTERAESMALVCYDPVPLLRPPDSEECGMRWHPFHALGLGPAAAPEALAQCQANDIALASLRRQVTIAYHHLSRKCRGRDVQDWLRRWVIAASVG